MIITQEQLILKAQNQVDQAQAFIRHACSEGKLIDHCDNVWPSKLWFYTSVVLPDIRSTGMLQQFIACLHLFAGPVLSA